MKASELRIGNWVQITGIEIQLNHPKQLAHILEQDGVDTRCQPIPLTEEWLVKLGFVADGNNFVLYLSDYSGLTFSGGKMYLTSGQFAEMTETVPCDYVHQLQNLCFALTGTELTIK